LGLFVFETEEEIKIEHKGFAIQSNNKTEDFLFLKYGREK
jgi:hypothetical protein